MTHTFNSVVRFHTLYFQLQIHVCRAIAPHLSRPHNATLHADITESYLLHLLLKLLHIAPKCLGLPIQEAGTLFAQQCGCLPHCLLVKRLDVLAQHWFVVAGACLRALRRTVGGNAGLHCIDVTRRARICPLHVWQEAYTMLSCDIELPEQQKQP